MSLRNTWAQVIIKVIYPICSTWVASLKLLGWIDWLRLVRLLHDMMVCTSVVVIRLKLGVEDDGGQVALHSFNNTVMLLSDIFLLNHDEEE